MTNYTVVRAQQDIDKGATQVGAIFTATSRNLHDEALDFLPRNAFTGGFRPAQNLERPHVFPEAAGASGAMSKAPPTAIRTLMLDPVHNYQRPTRRTWESRMVRRVSTARAARSGSARTTTAKWRYYGECRLAFPGLELNDLGLLKNCGYDPAIRPTAVL